MARLPDRWVVVLGSAIPLALAVAVLGASAWLGLELRRKAAPVSHAVATVVEAASVPVVLGHAELGHHAGPRSASSRHLFVDRRDGSWLIANAAPDRRVFARTRSGASFYLNRWPLRGGDRIALPSAELEVVEASERLEIRDVDTGRVVRFADGVLDPDGGEVHLVCHSALTRFAHRLRWDLREWSNDPVRLFSIGGGVDCTSRWSLPALEPQSIHVEWTSDGYQVAPGASGGDVTFARRGEPGHPFSSRTTAVEGADPITRLILGRTVYSVAATPEALSLEPVANLDLWRDDRPERDQAELAWSGAGVDPWAWAVEQAPWLLPGFVIALFVSIFLRARLAGRRREPGFAPNTTAGAVALAVIGIWCTLLTQRGEAADALVRYFQVLAAFGYALVVLTARGRLYGIGGLLFACGTALAALGTLVLLTLGAGADNTIWMRYFDKHALLLSGFGFALAALGALPTSLLRRAWISLFDSEWIVATAGLLLLFGMAAQLALGSEAGIGGLQPVELTKSVYVLLLAFAGMHLMEMRRRDTREYRRSPLAAILPFLRTIGGFALVVLSIVVGVRDFSPGIILGLLTLFWLFRVGRSVRAGGRSGIVWLAVRPLVIVAMASVVAAAAWARTHPETLPAGMPQLDRILVWSQPELHPHSGSQVLAGMDRVAEGGWLGTREWFGTNEEVMDVPAVQDDFITAFLLNRFGGAAGLALAALQLLYLALLFAIARGIETVTESADFREQSAGRTLGFALYGLAWMHAIHWVIAWCNTLGLLPVMGQPMTWLSAGNSHLVGFALVSLSIGLTTSWLLRDLRR